jgi:hypothetical protein
MWSSLKSAFAPVEKRQAVRQDATSGSVQIDSRFYPLVNWSATGVLIGGHGDHLAKGQRFKMQVEVKGGTDAIAFGCEALVVRKQGDKIAAQIVTIDKAVKARIHKYFGRRASA